MQTAKKLMTILLALMLMLQCIGEFGALYAEAFGEESGKEAAAEEAIGSEEPAGTEEAAEKEVPADEPEDPADTPENPEPSVDTEALSEESGTEVDGETGNFTTGTYKSLSEDALAGFDTGSEDELLYGYMQRQVSGKDKSGLLKSPREWTLTGKNLTYYKAIKAMAQKVAAGKQSETITVVPGAQLLSKSTYTAADLGIKKVAEKKDGEWSLTDEAEEKIWQLLYPESWDDVVFAAMLDMPYELYWFNKCDGSYCGFSIAIEGTISEKAITFNMASDKTFAEIYMPLIIDYAVQDGTTYDQYRADISKTGAVAEAVGNARGIISSHAEESDYDKLLSYMDEICALTEYDFEALSLIDDPTLADWQIYSDPWQLVSVFDGDPDTNVVCEGYGKAYKFLCDMSSFRSHWIECQNMYGEVSVVGSNQTPEAHLWCMVRMNNGLNYIVDPTWYDDVTGSNGQTVPGYYMFLQGGTTQGDSCDVDTYTNGDPSDTCTVRYTIDPGMRDLFSASELAIAAEDYDPQADTNNDVPISMASARISNVTSVTYTGSVVRPKGMIVQVDGRTLKEGVDFTVSCGGVNVGKASCTITGRDQYVGSKSITFNIIPKGTSLSSVKKGSKRFTVKWKKQTKKMKSKTITGYQIQYSTDSKFRTGNKTVTVKGAKKKSRTVKKLGKKKRYYVRIRTYLNTGGATYYSAWSAAKTVVTK